MRIKNLQITSSALDLDLDINKPVCILLGQQSELVLDLTRELIGDYGSENDPDRVDDGHFVIHSDIEMDCKNYAVCYIRNADFMGDNRIAANFSPNSFDYSKDDTAEFIDKCNLRDKDSSNIFNSFIIETSSEDDRPIFVYGGDEASGEAIHAILENLENSKRQVFISLSGFCSHKLTDYDFIQICDLGMTSCEFDKHIDTNQQESFVAKTKDIQEGIIGEAETCDENCSIKDVISAAVRGEFGSSELPEVGRSIDDIYAVILCPVCNHKTLDNHSICCHCGWEYDSVPDNYYSVANGATIDAYREEYRKIIQAFGGKENV